MSFLWLTDLEDVSGVEEGLDDVTAGGQDVIWIFVVLKSNKNRKWTKQNCQVAGLGQHISLITVTAALAHCLSVKGPENSKYIRSLILLSTIVQKLSTAILNLTR